jgi:putative transcriptional regulator
MSKLFEEMAQGTAEARAYTESIDVRGIRTRLHFSQGRFADAFGLSVDAVRHWESGRRNPEAAARALLMVIAHDPQVVMKALAQSQSSIPPQTGAGKRLTKSSRTKRSSAA